MPIGRKFIDSGGMRGRPYMAPKKETIITGKLSKSYDKELDDSHKRMHIRKDARGYIFTFDKVVGDRLIVKVKDMKALAKWILSKGESNELREGSRHESGQDGENE